jgi:protein gp37
MKFRPIKEDWVTSIRDQVKKTGLPFMLKHWSGKIHNSNKVILEAKTSAEYLESLSVNMDWEIVEKVPNW